MSLKNILLIEPALNPSNAPYVVVTFRPMFDLKSKRKVAIPVTDAVGDRMWVALASEGLLILRKSTRAAFLRMVEENLNDKDVKWQSLSNIKNINHTVLPLSWAKL